MNWGNKDKLTRLPDVVAGILVGSGIAVTLLIGIGIENIGFLYRRLLLIACASWSLLGLWVLVEPWISSLRHRRRLEERASGFAKPISSFGRAGEDVDRYACLISRLEQIRKSLPSDVYSKLREEYLLHLKEALEKPQTAV